MSKRTIKGEKGYEVSVEKDKFMSLEEADADIEDWWKENAPEVEGRGHVVSSSGEVRPSVGGGEQPS